MYGFNLGDLSFNTADMQDLPVFIDHYTNQKSRPPIGRVVHCERNQDGIQVVVRANGPELGRQCPEANVKLVSPPGGKVLVEPGIKTPEVITSVCPACFSKPRNQKRWHHTMSQYGLISLDVFVSMAQTFFDWTPKQVHEHMQYHRRPIEDSIWDPSRRYHDLQQRRVLPSHTPLTCNSSDPLQQAVQSVLDYNHVEMRIFPFDTLPVGMQIFPFDTLPYQRQKWIRRAKTARFNVLVQDARILPRYRGKKHRPRRYRVHNRWKTTIGIQSLCPVEVVVGPRVLPLFAPEHDTINVMLCGQTQLCPTDTALALCEPETLTDQHICVLKRIFTL